MLDASNVAFRTPYHLSRHASTVFLDTRRRFAVAADCSGITSIIWRSRQSCVGPHSLSCYCYQCRCSEQPCRPSCHCFPSTIYFQPEVCISLATSRAETRRSVRCTHTTPHVTQLMPRSPLPALHACHHPHVTPLASPKSLRSAPYRPPRQGPLGAHMSEGGKE